MVWCKACRVALSLFLDQSRLMGYKSHVLILFVFQPAKGMYIQQKIFEACTSLIFILKRFLVIGNTSIYLLFSFKSKEVFWVHKHLSKTQLLIWLLTHGFLHKRFKAAQAVYYN